jgi:predicted Zn-ribbon and HTH transcriptional regulator
MTRPPVEVADIVRAQGNRFIENHSRWIHWTHRKVLQAIANCRTAVLGGHRDQCSRCGYQTISYNSCRNRHCPKCQSGAREKWLAARQNDLLAVAYLHVVFTLPQQLSQLALQNKKVLYDRLFRASAETLLEVARNPKHLGAEIGFLSVLHTWGQNLLHHPHVHCVIPSGGLTADHHQWVHPRYPFFLPVAVLSRVFRGKFVAGLRRAFQQHQLTFAGTLKPLENEKAFRSFLRTLFRYNWVVYAKPPFGGPHHVLGYLARYTHRVAITNHRLLAFDQDRVTFRWKDYAHGNKKKKMCLSADEFLRRFLLHVLPRGFVRIRCFGFWANRCRATLLPQCRVLLLHHPKPHVIPLPNCNPPSSAFLRCPQCASPMIIVETFSGDIRSPLTIRRPSLDSS